MAQATSISLSKFTETVQAAVKVAVEKHPKFRTEAPSQLALSYLIRGIPVPEIIAGNVTLRETQAFANDLASQIAANAPGLGALAGAPVEGAVFAQGRHLILGFPAVPHVLIER